MSGCNRGTTAEQKGPELIIPRKFVRREKKIWIKLVVFTLEEK